MNVEVIKFGGTSLKTKNARKSCKNNSKFNKTKQ